MPIDSSADISRLGPAQCYRFFDTCVSSEVPLPELAPCSRDTVQIQVRVETGRPPDGTGFVTSHTWYTPGGAIVCRSSRCASYYMLWLPGQASFLIDDAAATIRCFPALGLDAGSLRQLLLNQVLPRYLAHGGGMLLHASAVSLPNGRTVAFLGQSGAGKSTLASYCLANGARFIDDDCVLVRFDGNSAGILGGVPTIRLFEDSLAALGHTPDDFAPYAADSAKRQLCLPVGSTPGPAPRKLDSLYLLTLPSEQALARGRVRIEPATGSEAMMAIMGCTFSLDPADVDTMTRIFGQAGQLLAALPDQAVNHLQYPREHDKLPQVLRALLDLSPI